MKKTLLVAVSLLTLGAGAAQAQSKFTLKLGGGFPTGDFGDFSMREDGSPVFILEGDTRIGPGGAAGTGFNVGVQWKLMEIKSVQGLDLVLSADAFYNALNSDIRDMVAEAATRFSYYSLAKYLNFPVMLGLNYGTGIAPNIGLYGEAAAGLNLRYITSNIWEKNEQEARVNYGAETSFGYRVAVGLIFSSRYSVELGYYNLGSAKVKEEAVLSENGIVEYTEKRYVGRLTPTLLTLRLGIAL